LNTSFQTPVNKLEKALLIARNWHTLLPIPEECRVFVETCLCPVQHCECAVELCLQGGTRDVWRDNADFCDRMHAFLLAVDPTNYAERYIDPKPLIVLSRDQRLEAMRKRILQGYVAKNPKDLEVSKLKIGEGAARGRNGMAYSKGLEDIEDDEPVCGRIG
jgi:hypothetical protein